LKHQTEKDQTKRMAFENFLCTLVILFFFGFIVGLLTGRYKISVTTSQHIYPSYPNCRPWIYRNHRSNNQVQASRQRNNNSTNSGSVFDSGLPTYQASTNAANTRNFR